MSNPIGLGLGSGPGMIPLACRADVFWLGLLLLPPFGHFGYTAAAPQHDYVRVVLMRINVDAEARLWV